MEIGNDDLDFFEEDLELSTLLPKEDIDPELQEQNLEGNEQEVLQFLRKASDDNNQEDFISALLKLRGIEDRSKIKFEDEEGEIQELNWDELSNNERINILNSSSSDPEKDLDDSEVLLINSIRESGMTPAEYINHLQEESINSYIQNNKPEHQYLIDLYSDDELFVFDFISRMGDVTDEEALEALEAAKSNLTLFNKLIAAIRNEYKAMEEENLRLILLELEEESKENYNLFSNLIASIIDNFNDFSGYDLNLDDEDKDTLYEFITGFDGAGNNYFAKALSDPDILVLTAWFALNGRLMMDDITSYFLNEIKKVRKESYEKGLAEAKNKINNTSVVFSPKEKGDNTTVYSDLDDF